MYEPDDDFDDDDTLDDDLDEIRAAIDALKAENWRSSGRRSAT